MSELSYQRLSDELEVVLAKLQDTQTQVDEAIALYEQGMRLVTKLEKHLQTAENKLTKLKRGS